MVSEKFKQNIDKAVSDCDDEDLKAILVNAKEW